jgi:hypothetical protein
MVAAFLVVRARGSVKNHKSHRSASSKERAVSPSAKVSRRFNVAKHLHYIGKLIPMSSMKYRLK